MPRRCAVVTRLERRYADFDGLNLTWDTLEGLVKHNGPLTDRAGRADRRAMPCTASPRPSSTIAALQDLELWSYRQRRGAGGRASPTTSPMTPTTSTTACAPTCSRSTISATLPLARRPPARDRRRPSAASSRRAACHELIRRLITRMIEDVIAESRRRLAAAGARSADEVRRAGGAGDRVLRRDGRRPTGRSRRSCCRACTATQRVMRIMGEAEQRRRRSVRRLHARRRPSCRAEWRQGLDRCDDTAPGPPHRRLHRRHDRPLRPDRACAAVRDDAGASLIGRFSSDHAVNVHAVNITPSSRNACAAAAPTTRRSGFGGLNRKPCISVQPSART